MALAEKPFCSGFPKGILRGVRFAALSAGAEQSAVFKECQCEENPHEDVLQKAIRPVPVTNQPGAALKSVKRPADEQKNVRASHRNSFQDRK